MTGCYHGNYSYHFNEPQCGKDQCDNESAAAKTIIHSYAGNDLIKIPKISEYHCIEFHMVLEEFNNHTTTT